VIEALRSFRIGPFAVFDFATAYFGMYLVAPLLSRLFLKIGVSVPRSSWLWLTLPIAIVVHLAIGLQTPLMKTVVDPTGHYLAKLALIAMLIMGLRRISLVKK